MIQRLELVDFYIRRNYHKQNRLLSVPLYELGMGPHYGQRQKGQGAGARRWGFVVFK